MLSVGGVVGTVASCSLVTNRVVDERKDEKEDGDNSRSEPSPGVSGLLSSLNCHTPSERLFARRMFDPGVCAM